MLPASTLNGPFPQNHGEQSIRAELREQRQALLQLLLRISVIGDVVQAALGVPETVELGVLVVEVQLLFHFIHAEQTRRENGNTYKLVGRKTRHNILPFLSENECKCIPNDALRLITEH